MFPFLFRSIERDETANKLVAKSGPVEHRFYLPNFSLLRGQVDLYILVIFHVCGPEAAAHGVSVRPRPLIQSAFATKNLSWVSDSGSETTYQRCIRVIKLEMCSYDLLQVGKPVLWQLKHLRSGRDCFVATSLPCMGWFLLMPDSIRVHDQKVEMRE